jgi:hypothetical protein
MSEAAPESPGAPRVVPPAATGPSVAQQWVVIVAGSVIVAAMQAADVVFNRQAAAGGQMTPFTCFAAALGALTQMLWITMDCKRNGREVGWWRFAAFFLGPLAIWIYLGAQCRGRALVLFPPSIAVYATGAGLSFAGAAVGLALSAR